MALEDLRRTAAFVRRQASPSSMKKKKKNFVHDWIAFYLQTESDCHPTALTLLTH